MESDKTNKNVKDYSYKGRLEELKLTILPERRMRGNLIETYKMISVISNHGRHFFNISPRTGYLLSRQISKPEYINQRNYFVNRVKYFGNK